MIRSMYAAVSGLRSHQTMMDVTGNNIANVNTTGFKKSAAIFQDILSQTLNGAGAPTQSLGGTNPNQIGLGAQVGGIAQNFLQGALQSTGRSLDLAIQGDGFFTLEQEGQQLFTRAGSMFVDSNGNLVGVNGGFVQGWEASPAGVINPSGPYGRISIPAGEQVAPVITSEINLGGNLPVSAALGDTQVAGLYVYDSVGAPVELELTFTKTSATDWTVSATYGPSVTPVALTDNTLVFDANGEVTSPADLSVDIAAGGIPVWVPSDHPGRTERHRSDHPTLGAGLDRRAEPGRVDGRSARRLQRRPGRPHHRDVHQRPGASDRSGRDRNFANPEGLEKAGGTTSGPASTRVSPRSAWPVQRRPRLVAPARWRCPTSTSPRSSPTSSSPSAASRPTLG